MAKRQQTKAKEPAKRTRKRNGDGTGTNSTPRKGRPTKFTPELGAEICAAIANGATLTSLCMLPKYPARETVWRWMQAHTEFEDEYLRARVFSQQMHGDEAIDIARTEEDIARARVMIDARRMVVGRLASQYAGLIQARMPEQQPFDLAGAIEANRKKLDDLVKEVGHERAQRIREDEAIEKARNPDQRIGEELIRANQRYALHVLEERKKALLAVPVTDQPI